MRLLSQLLDQFAQTGTLFSWGTYLLLIIPFISVSAVAQEEAEDPAAELRILDSWLAFRNAPNALYTYLAEQAIQLLGHRKAEVAGLRTLADWKDRQAAIKKTLTRIVGPFPERTPLNARVLRTIEKDGFRVEHVVYESLPGFHITASLFLPADRQESEKRPAVIYAAGHSPSGYHNAYYQQTILNLVRKGFVVLAFDPIAQGERFQYLDEATGNSVLGRPTREHAYCAAQAFLTGASLARYVVWDGIRTVDYLVSRSEVDPERIGMTGRSGGGFQSQYIGAFDERIYATAPENHVTNYTRMMQSIGPRDGEQNLFHMFASGIDHPELLTVRAPRPMLMVTTTNDIFNIHGCRETFQEVSRVYEAYDEPGRFSMVEEVAPHRSVPRNREAIYAFFQEHLRHPGSPRDEEVQALEGKDIQVTPTGQVASSFESETVFSLNRKEGERLHARLAESRKTLESHLAAIPDLARKTSGYIEPETAVEPIQTGAVKREGYTIRKYFVMGEGNYPIPYLLMVPDTQTDKAVIVLHPDGKVAGALPGGELEQLVLEGFVVLTPDLVGTGEVGSSEWRKPNWYKHITSTGLTYPIWYASVLIGRSIVAIRAGDVNRLVSALQATVEPSEIIGVAHAEMSPVMLHAAAFNPAIQRVALLSPLASYRAIVEERFYSPGYIDNSVAGGLRHYDLPDLAATLAPRPLLMANVVDGKGASTDDEGVLEDLAVVRAGYEHRKAVKALHIVTVDSNQEELTTFVKQAR